MTLLLDDLTINISRINAVELLDSWKWLVTDLKQVLLISKMGDIFLSDIHGAVYWLAIDEASFTKIADNQTEFDQLLGDEGNLDNWFLPLLIEKLVKAGKLLSSRQVYSFTKLPVLGGDYEVNNLEPTDVKIHFDLTGMIHEHIKDIPDGTPVKIKLIP